MSFTMRCMTPSAPFPTDMVAMLARERQQELIREAAERRLAGSPHLPRRARRRFVRWP